MTRLSVAIAVAIAALAAAPAWAKEVKAVKVCGRDGCAEVTDRQDMRVFLEGGLPTAPPKAGDFYTVEIVVTDGKAEHSWTVDYVPSANAVRSEDGFGNDVWTSVESSPAVEKAIAGLEPIPASKLTGAAEPAKTDAKVDARTDAPSPQPAAAEAPWGLVWVASGACVLLAGLMYARRRRARGAPAAG